MQTAKHTTHPVRNITTQWKLTNARRLLISYICSLGSILNTVINTSNIAYDLPHNKFSINLLSNYTFENLNIIIL